MVAIGVLLAVVAILLACILRVLLRAVHKLPVSLAELRVEVRDLRLTSRTRIGQASMPTGVPTEEQELSRLGRASSAQRVVVGGDENSQQHKAQARQGRASSGRVGGAYTNDGDASS